MNPLEILGFIAGGITCVSFVPQIFKTWKSKSVKDISISTFAIISSSNLLWLIYGILMKLPSVIITNIIVLVSALVMIYMKLTFKEK